MYQLVHVMTFDATLPFTRVRFSKHDDQINIHYEILYMYTLSSCLDDNKYL